MRTSTILCSIVLLLGSLVSLVSLAGDGHCDRCGCCCQCQKVCRVVCEMKEVDKVCYSCKCEDFCVPGPSQHCHHGCDCDQCCKTQIPTAAYVKTKRVLVKTVEKVKKPHYKLVVEYLCPTCRK